MKLIGTASASDHMPRGSAGGAPGGKRKRATPCSRPSSPARDRPRRPGTGSRATISFSWSATSRSSPSRACRSPPGASSRGSASAARPSSRALSVTTCAWSSSMRARYSPICSRVVAMCCSMLAISLCSLRSSSTAPLSGPSTRRGREVGADQVHPAGRADVGASGRRGVASSMVDARPCRSARRSTRKRCASPELLGVGGRLRELVARRRRCGGRTRWPLAEAVVERQRRLLACAAPRSRRRRAAR